MNTMNIVGFNKFTDQWQANAQLALDTIAMRPTHGLAVGGFGVNDMQWSHLEIISGNPPGSYEREPVRVYREFQLAAGVCFIDQWIPENPLSMRDQGYESDKPRGATWIVTFSGLILLSSYRQSNPTRPACPH